jgi:hypothetical protein
MLLLRLAEEGLAEKPLDGVEAFLPKEPAIAE